MRRMWTSLFLSCLLILPTLSLTWDEAVKLGQAASPALKSAAARTEAARWTYYQSLTNYLPAVAASASLGESSGTRSSSLGLSATQYLFKGFDYYFSSAASRNDYLAAQASQREAEAEYFYDLRLAFISLAIGEENRRLLEKILERRRNNSELVELRFDNGREDRGVLLRTQADLAEAEYSLSSAKRDLRLAGLNLSQLLSYEVKTAELTGEAATIARPDFTSLLTAAPARELAQRELETADLRYRKTISGFLPSVSLSGNYRRTGSDWPPDSSSRSWSLSLSYSLFPGGSNLTERISAAASLDKAREDFRKTSLDQRYELESAYEKLADALESFRSAAVYLSALVERAEIGRTKYLNGLIGYDDWDRIENDYISAQKNYLARKKSAWLAEAAWHKAYGGYVK